MATIVDIRTAAAAKSKQVAHGERRGSADVLLFTGVRYERWHDVPASALAGRQTTKRRDHLELED